MNILIEVLTLVVYLASGAFIFMTAYDLIRLLAGANISGVIEEKANRSLKKRGKFDQSRLEMSREGILFRLGDYNASPLSWTLRKVLAGLLAGGVIYIVTNNILLMIIGFAAGYFGLVFLFSHLNKKDNDAMLMDIYNTYSTIQIQLESGLYISDAIAYSYKMSYNKRYKEALYELVLNISDKTMTMAEAVEIFRNRFSNPEINKMCGMLTSFALYGVTDEYTQDIMNQITAIIESATLKAEADIESKASFVNFAFFVCVVALVAVSIAMSFSGMDLFSV